MQYQCEEISLTPCLKVQSKTHARACRIIDQLPSKVLMIVCLFNCNWLTLDYLNKRRTLLKMKQVCRESARNQIS